MPEDVVNMIVDRLDRIENKIDTISLHGCAKQEMHSDHETRIKSLEIDRAKAAGAIASISAVCGVAGAWIARKLGI